MDWNRSNRERGTTEWATRDGRDGFIDPETSKYIKKLFEDAHHNGINFEKYFDIPITISEQDIPQMFEFSDCEVHPALLQNLHKFGYKKPTPVQQYAIPVSLLRRDLMACAQTGSGKTAAYLYPLVAKMLQDGPPPPVSKGNARPLALVLAPTRELTVQIYEEALKFTYLTGIRVVVVYGGASMTGQQQSLIQGADVIIATPGRLIDFAEKKYVDLYLTRYLILDEADRMLDMGFEPQLIRILTEIKKVDRETIMCSATFPREIQTIAKKYLRDYVYLTIGRVGSTTDNITQKLYLVSHSGKEDFLITLLTELQGQILSNFYSVFVERKTSANDLSFFLSNQGVPCACIHGDRVQHEREKALSDFKKQNIKILIATDVASRGLDIPNVAYVIIFDMPTNIDSYVHRIGRTGRIGNTGMAIALIDERPNAVYKDLLDLLMECKQEIPDWFKELANGGIVDMPVNNFSRPSNRSRGRGGFGDSHQDNFIPNSYSSGYGNNSEYNRPRGGYGGNSGGYPREDNYSRGGYGQNRGSGNSYRGNGGGWGMQNEGSDYAQKSPYESESYGYQNGRGRDYGRGNGNFSRGNSDYRGNSDFNRGNSDYRGNSDFNRGNSDYSRGNFDYQRGNSGYSSRGSSGYGENSRGNSGYGENYRGRYENRRPGGFGRGVYSNNVESEGSSFRGGNRGRPIAYNNPPASDWSTGAKDDWNNEAKDEWNSFPAPAANNYSSYPPRSNDEWGNPHSNYRRNDGNRGGRPRGGYENQNSSYPPALNSNGPPELPRNPQNEVDDAWGAYAPDGASGWDIKEESKAQVFEAGKAESTNPSQGWGSEPPKLNENFATPVVNSNDEDPWGGV